MKRACALRGAGAKNPEVNDSEIGVRSPSVAYWLGRCQIRCGPVGWDVCVATGSVALPSPRARKRAGPREKAKQWDG